MLENLNYIVLFLFIVTTVTLLAVTVINRLRIRRVQFSWASSKWGGFPVAPSLFLLVMVPLLGYVLMSGNAVLGIENPALVIIGYVCGGIFWYLAALLSDAIVVTEYGIIRNVNRMHESISWGQIEDYFVVEEKRVHRYTLIYASRGGEHSRADVRIPSQYEARLNHIMASKVDARYEYTLERTYGTQALNE